MLRNQDITVPYGDTRRVEWDIDDVIAGIEEGPTPLAGKGVRWDLYRDSRASNHLHSVTNDGDTLVTTDPENGIVSLYLTADLTTFDLRNGRYYLRITDGDDRWTVATGSYTLTR